ncbi:hypothetical protein LCER1_G007154 [Lachnellula cervina]|uniref:DUF1446-domain-containing protein n=1 Tax=Lachnellula cervina TaxID=1316786 RepID=A0A7D8UMG6_9HELO|nr:hypothetical protein LCER1_G007154 [Lachnellula cervina]
MNLAENAEAMNAGTHPGYEATALEGLTLSLEVLNQKRIKVAINGGALNSQGLAQDVQKMVEEKKLNLKVAWVSGDNLMDRAEELLHGQTKHLDADNSQVRLAKDTDGFLDDPKKPLVSCNAYLGARAITLALRQGADIVICGRVSDASPVIAAAQWWHGWSDTAYDELAGALIAGHLIECSTYSTGANFAGFYKYETSALLDLGLPIVEIESSGECTVTKADKFNGIVNTDTIACQLLYELQGDIYLNSCVKADISNVSISQEAENRVHVEGIKGHPPPETTKLAVYYSGGWQCEITMNATGYATEKKYDLFEAQIKHSLKNWGVLDKFDILECFRAGVPQPNANFQMAATTYMRVFVQAVEKMTLFMFLKACGHNGMQHFAGANPRISCCASGDNRTAVPKTFLAYYPGMISQKLLNEEVHFLGPEPATYSAGHPPVYEALAPRRNFPPTNPLSIDSFGETVLRPLGDIALARSGDKGANINIGIFVHTDEEWDWLRSFLTAAKMEELVGDDWKPDFYIERVEFTHLKAVHFVIYGILGRGVSSSSRLDSLGKAFAEYIRFRHVPIPIKFLQ